MTKFKIGAIVKEVTKGAEKWYLMAGWTKLEKQKKEKKNDKTNSEETPAK